MSFKTIGLIVKNSDRAVVETLQSLHAYLSSEDRAVYLDESASGLLESVSSPVVSRDELGDSCDLAIIIGGDGTLLHAVRSLSEKDISIMGVNLGRLGFLVDVSPLAMIEHIGQILQGNFVQETRFLLQASVYRGKEVLYEDDALNDVVIHIRDVARMIELETYINDKLVNDQRADGLIVSTPTGSTAYALSSGGPLLHSTLDAMVLVPICPHTLSNRPLVVHADSRVEIVYSENNEVTAQVTCDGQSSCNLEAGDRITIKRKPQQICLVHPKNYDYFEILRAKLRWSEQLK